MARDLFDSLQIGTRCRVYGEPAIVVQKFQDDVELAMDTGQHTYIHEKQADEHIVIDPTLPPKVYE